LRTGSDNQFASGNSIKTKTIMIRLEINVLTLGIYEGRKWDGEYKTGGRRNRLYKRSVDAPRWPGKLAQMSTAAETKTAANGMVVSNPGILGGIPVFCGTRLPVHTLFDYLVDGLTLDYYLETFDGVTREQVKEVLRFGRERIATELHG